MPLFYGFSFSRFSFVKLLWRVAVGRTRKPELFGYFPSFGYRQIIEGGGFTLCHTSNFLN